MSTRSEISNELAEIIAAHIVDVELYMPGTRVFPQPVSEELLARVERLIEITRLPPHVVSRETYREAAACLDEVVSFLQVMNHSTSRAYANTALDRMLMDANTWCSLVPTKIKESPEDVWDLIAPAIPDTIRDLGSGQYEARWWKPVPVMDVELLKYTDGIRVLADPFEPVTLSGGLALRFAIAEHTTNVPAE
ncbi:MAG: hypothetical protein IT319_03810 [Anaerolineae bacterium]|nr:hypothetical protein [Anaerolineae bacterium]